MLNTSFDNNLTDFNWKNPETKGWRGNALVFLIHLKRKLEYSIYILVKYAVLSIFAVCFVKVREVNAKLFYLSVSTLI